MAVPFRERITCTINEACEATGIGRSKMYELIDAREIETTKEGARRLINVPSLLARFDRKVAA
jgi:excisionase family DNA binding protein